MKFLQEGGMKMKKQQRKKRKRGLLSVMTAAVLAAGIGASFSGMSVMAAGTENPIQTAETGEVTVNFKRVEDSSSERGEISGISAQGDVIWQYVTETYPRTELDRVNDIGTFDGRYYLVEGGTVKAFDLGSGSVIWSNDEFTGCAYGSDFGEDGTLYVCGYYGPDLFVVDGDGNTLKRIDFFHKDYIWPHKIEYLGDQLAITYSGTPSGAEETLYINLGDYSLASGPNAGATAGAAGSPVTDSAVETITASSYLEEPQYGLSHGTANLMDGDLSTAWVESAEGQGEGEAITLKLNGTYEVSGFTIYAGYQKNGDIYAKNSRPARITVIFSDGSSQSMELSDINGPQKITFGKPVNTSSIRFVIDSVYPGNKYQDTAVSEISLF